MDPFLLSLTIAIAGGISTVAGTLIQKGVIDPALEPATAKLKQLVQGGVQAIEKNDALTRAILAAIEDASGQEGESLAVDYARRLRLHTLVEPAHVALRDEAMRLVYLASSEDSALVPDRLLTALNLDASQRVALARFLFSLRRRLYGLPEFKPLLDAAHQQRVEAALQQWTAVIQDGAVRVRVVENEWNPAPYLRYLAAECNRLRLSAIDPQYVTLNGESKITLVQVYTDLEVETPVPVELEPRGTERSREQDIAFQRERGETRRLTALEAASDPKSSCVVLLGAPGAGKSTFANYLTFCLTMAQLESETEWLPRLTCWTRGTLLPVRIVLRDLIAWADADPERKRKPTAQTLWGFIQHDLTENGFADAFEPLKKHLQAYGGLVVLDGLDEVPDAEARREFVKTAIESFARACPVCRVLVTCRPYA